MALTYDQLIKSDASNPEAVKALTGLLGIPTGGGEDFYSNPKNFNANLQNLQRMIGEQVAGARGSSPNGEFQKFGEYQAWGGDVSPLQAQLKGVQDKYAAAGVDFNSSPLAVLQKIAGLSPTLSPTDNGSRVTSQNYGGNVWENIPAGGQPTQVTQPNNNRSLISQTAQAGYIKGYDTNNNYAPVYVPKGVYVPGISATPKQITTSSLTGTGTTSLPGATGTGVNEAGAMVAGASTNIAEIMKQMTPPETEADKKQQSLLDQMASLVGDQANKAADQLTAEQSAGLPDLKKQFADINAQILSKVAAYNALQTDLEGKPITMNSIIGAQAQVQKVQASEIGLLQARAQGLQGQIEVAQQTANRAVDLKYSTIEAKLNVYQAQLNALQPTLNKEEKLQAQAQQILLDQQKQAIADTKAEEKEKNKIILDYINDYKDAGITFDDTLASAQAKLKGSRIYQQATRLVGGENPSNPGPRNQNNPSSPNSPNDTNETLTDYNILAEAVSNKLGSVAAKNSFLNQYNKAKTDEDRLKILASNVVLPAPIKEGIIQNSQVVRSLNGVLGLLDSGVKTGLLKAGESYIANKFGSGADKQVENIKSQLITAIQPYRNKVTGAAWGTQEEAEYQALLGSIKFSPEDLRNKLNVFKQTLASQSQAAIMAGIDPLGAINQNSVLNNQTALTPPVLETTPQTTQSANTGGWWSKTKNFLFGD